MKKRLFHFTMVLCAMLFVMVQGVIGLTNIAEPSTQSLVVSTTKVSPQVTSLETLPQKELKNSAVPLEAAAEIDTQLIFRILGQVFKIVSGIAFQIIKIFLPIWTFMFKLTWRWVLLFFVVIILCAMFGD